MGKAVVANDHPEQRLMIEQSGGGYCVPYQEKAFAAAIIRLLEAPDTARVMGQRGRQYVLENRSYVKIADQGGAHLGRRCSRNVSVEGHDRQQTKTVHCQSV